MTVSNEQIAARLDRGDRRFRELEKKLEALPQLQEDMAAVREIVELLAMAKTVSRFAVGVAKVMKWAAGLAASAGMIWAAVKAFRGAW